MTEVTIIYGRVPRLSRRIVEAPIKYQQRGPDRKVDFTDIDMLAIGEAFYRALCSSADLLHAKRPSRSEVARYNIVAVFGGNDAHAAFCPEEPFSFPLPVPADEHPAVQ